MKLASPADSLRDSSRIPPRRARGGGTRDESLRESAGEARMKKASFGRFSRTFFVIVRCAAVLFAPTLRNDFNVNAWTKIFHFSVQTAARTNNNREMVAERRSYFIRWCSCCRRWLSLLRCLLTGLFFVLSEHLAQLQQAVLKIIDIKSAEPVSEGEEYGPSSPLSPTAVNRRPRIRTSSMSSADTTLSESSDRVTNHLSSIV